MKGKKGAYHRSVDAVCGHFCDGLFTDAFPVREGTRERVLHELAHHVLGALGKGGHLIRHCFGIAFSRDEEIILEQRP